MSVEAMSGGSVGIGAISAPTVSFGGELSRGSVGGLSSGIGTTIDNGGGHQPSLDGSLFSMPELTAPPASDFNPGRQISADLAFTNTQDVWSAKSLPTTDSSPTENVETLGNTPPMDTLLEQQLSDIVDDSEKTTPEVSMPTTEIEEVVTPNYTEINEIVQKIEKHNNPAYEISHAEEQLVKVVDALPETDAKLPDAYDENAVETLDQISEAPKEKPEIYVKNEEATLTLNQIAEKVKAIEVEETGTLEMQEVKADVLQAVKVEESLKSAGVPEEKAQEMAFAELEKTAKKKQMTATLQKLQNDGVSKVPEDNKGDKSVLPQPSAIMTKKYIAHDSKTDAARVKTAEKAISKVAKKVETGEKGIVTGYDLAKELPNDPQTEEVKSEVLKEARLRKDGSYEEANKELEKVGVIYSSKDAIKIIGSIYQKHHAVRFTDTPPSSKATEKEVKEVLSGSIDILGSISSE